MGEMTVLGEIVELITGPYQLWLVVGIMSVLGSLAGIFTFCVRRKRASYDVSRRKKTDERTQDDDEEDTTNRATVVDTNRHDDTLSPNNTTEDNRLCNQTMETDEEDKAGNEQQVGNSALINEVEPIINGAGDGKEEAEEPEVNDIEIENGIEDVLPEATQPAATQTKPLSNGISDDHTHNDINNYDGNVAMVNDESDVAIVNGDSDVAMVNGDSDVAMVNGNTQEKNRWSFPPKLEDFDLMKTNIDPSELEMIFLDERLVEIYLNLDPESGLGITIVGGTGSPNGGDLPIIIKRVLHNGSAEKDGRLKSGDELIAVNDSLLVGVAKDVATETLSNLSGTVRLLAIQDD